MKTQKFKRTVSLLLAMLMCVTTLFGMGTTAFAAEETDEVYLISYPRDGDANYGGEWGHDSLSFMNGWSTATSRFTTIRAMGSYEGNICYCIEPGVPQQTGNTFTKKGEDFWDEYPSSYNSTISPDDIKLFIGRIFQYGYTGTISTSWRSQNEGGDKLAHAVATQLLIWETVVGERDADFNKVGTGGKSAIVEQISTNHPLYSQIMRKREFAVLRSVGMTVNKLFAMLCIENLRNGLLAILIGGISSLPLCYLIYKSIVVGAVIDFVFPLGAFVISSLAMFLIMFLTSLYGLWKIKNGDIIADVRNDFV